MGFIYRKSICAVRVQLTYEGRHWQRWLANVNVDLMREPQRIANLYQTRAIRLEPVDLQLPSGLYHRGIAARISTAPRPGSYL